jgi:glutamate N-acetyltransferase/amino-acid N-acetyltransferase
MHKIEEIEGGITAVPGVKAAGINCGIKGEGLDLALVYSTRLASCAGAMTKNRVKAAPLFLNAKRFKKGIAQAIVINSGNANALNGKRGLLDADEMASITAECLGIDKNLVIVASTGIIGRPLPMEKLKDGIPRVVASLSEDGGGNAAKAIMTTDTVKKEFAIRYQCDKATVTIGGMAKGSGMIHPRLATMLAFIATDASISPAPLRRLLREAVEESFNTILVDGDTSTNDLVVLLANGENQDFCIKEEKGKFYRGFREALEYLMLALAKMIVRDGEGATKFIKIRIKGAKSHREAKGIAKAVASSNLVKCAFYGEDPNVGRIMAAVGCAGYPIDQEGVDVYLGRMMVIRGGEMTTFDRSRASRIMAKREVEVTIDLNRGESEATVFTCDLSPEYVRINASYS